MHPSALATGREFFAIYGKAGGKVLDVGSLNVNGTLRLVAPLEYIGCDRENGPGVDVVLKDPYILPWPSDEFDLVVSTSCFEHDEFFWETFVEMARVVKPGGFIYMSAPVQGPVHRHPVDCWRFYPDAGGALARWAQRSDLKIELIESFILPPSFDVWSDFVAVWGKVPFRVPSRKLNEAFSNAQHIS